MNIIALIKRNISKGKQPPELHACPHLSRDMIDGIWTYSMCGAKTGEAK